MLRVATAVITRVRVDTRRRGDVYLIRRDAIERALCVDDESEARGGDAFYSVIERVMLRRRF